MASLTSWSISAPATALLAVLSSCSPEPVGETLPVLEHPFEAGVGVGDLRLGESTYLDCLLSTEGWKATFSGSDEGYSVELYKPRVALRLEFPLGPGSMQTMDLDVLKGLVRDAENTARAQPLIGQARLGRIVFGPPRLSDSADGKPCGGVGLDGTTHPSIQLGVAFHAVVDGLGPGDVPKDPVLPPEEDAEEDAPPKYREGDFSLSWPGLSIGFSKPRGSDPEEEPYVTSFVLYTPRDDD